MRLQQFKAWWTPHGLSAWTAFCGAEGTLPAPSPKAQRVTSSKLAALLRQAHPLAGRDVDHRSRLRTDTWRSSLTLRGQAVVPRCARQTCCCCSLGGRSRAESRREPGWGSLGPPACSEDRGLTESRGPPRASGILCPLCRLLVGSWLLTRALWSLSLSVRPVKLFAGLVGEVQLFRGEPLGPVAPAVLNLSAHSKTRVFFRFLPLAGLRGHAGLPWGSGSECRGEALASAGGILASFQVGAGWVAVPAPPSPAAWPTWGEWSLLFLPRITWFETAPARES